jgi:hypothetical protein
MKTPCCPGAQFRGSRGQTSKLVQADVGVVVDRGNALVVHEHLIGLPVELDTLGRVCLEGSFLHQGVEFRLKVLGVVLARFGVEHLAPKAEACRGEPLLTARIVYEVVSSNRIEPSILAAKVSHPVSDGR